jgi:tRNA A58 N-methylase Trm61
VVRKLLNVAGLVVLAQQVLLLVHLLHMQVVAVEQILVIQAAQRQVEVAAEVMVPIFQQIEHLGWITLAAVEAVVVVRRVQVAPALSF